MSQDDVAPADQLAARLFGRKNWNRKKKIGKFLVEICRFLAGVEGFELTQERFIPSRPVLSRACKY